MSGIMLAAALGGNKLTVSLNPPNVSTGSNVGGHVGPMTAIPAGGSGAYSYSWDEIQPDPNYALTINSPLAATTDFDFAPVSGGDIARSLVRCTVTDTGTGAIVYAEGHVTHVDQTSGSPGGGVGVIP